MIDHELPVGWEWVRLEDVQADQRGATVTGPFGSSIGSKYFVPSGVPVIRGNNLTLDRTRFVEDGFAFLSFEKAREFTRYEAVPGDLIFTAAGTLGQVGLIPVDAKYPKYIISNKQMRARLDPARVDPLYAYYWFSSPEMIAYVERHNTGSSVPLINLSVLRNLPIPLPPIKVQRQILACVMPFDDKIELNRRMNETLEAMARAIFKSWFVDFDPVRAKAEGRQPQGIPAHTADLFPNSFQDSPLGPIPKGWEVGRLDQFLQLKRGYDLPSKSRVEGPVPLCSASGITGSHNEAKVKGPGVVTGRSGLLGKVFLLLRDFWPLNTTLYVREFRRVGPYSAYHLLRHVGLDRFNAGSAVPTLNRNHVHNLPLPMAKATLYEAFDDLVQPMYELIKANERESDTLESTRDTLLPKLLSGEVTV